MILRSCRKLKQREITCMASGCLRRVMHLHSGTSSSPCSPTSTEFWFSTSDFRARAHGSGVLWRQEPQMSAAFLKAIKKSVRKRKLAEHTPSPSAAFLWSSGLSLSGELDSASRLISDVQGGKKCRHRLNWNPLSIGPARQFSVRHNTQAASPPTTPNSGSTPSLLLTSTATVPATFNARRAFLVDTLALMRKLEAQELSQRQAEAITSVVTTVLNDSLETVAQSYTSKAEMQRCEMVQDATLSKFKAEMQSSLEHHFATLQRESERLRTDMEKMRSELRYEIDKVQANQRLDLNLERGHIRDELNKQQTETSTLTNKIDREIHSLKTQLEAAKYDVIKYCIGTIVSVTALGLGLLRIIM